MVNNYIARVFFINVSVCSVMYLRNITQFGAIFIALAYLPASGVAQALPAKRTQSVQPAQMGDNEHEFLFAGLCFNGETYRIYAYEKIINGYTQSFYDYRGPVGQGTVMSTASPKTLVERICRQTAEIANSF